MKKVVLSLVFVALSVMTFAQQWTSIGKNVPAEPEVVLVSSSEQQVVVDFTLNGYYLTRVETPNGIQQVVSVPKMAAMLEAGAPDLPQFPVPAIIGDMAEMQVNVTKYDYTDYENVEIAPSKGNFSRQIDPKTVPYTYGAMYSQNAFYPAQRAHLEAPYILRDFRGQNIMVTPFAYNPVTKTLRVYHHLTLTMNKVSNNGVNQKASRKTSTKVSPEMDAAYAHRFINYKEQAAKYNFVHDRGEMIVICPEQYMDAMQPYVDWKNQSGRPTTMVSVTEAGGNNDTQIKNYISGIYNDPERNLEFILLIGDYADLTPHSIGGGRGDNWFGQLEGNDYYLEVLTGRFSVQSVQDVETHVNKVLYYERDMPEGLTWANKGLGIGAIGAGSGHFGEDDYQHIDFIRDTLEHYTYEHVTELHDGGGASATSISATINEGVSIINYCNHGSETSWGVANYSNSHVNALVNDNMWPFVWSVACLNGKFDHSSPCFAEAWLRATDNSTGVPTGAVGGMFSWISQPWIPPMYGQDEMVDILCEWRGTDNFDHTLAGASLNGSMYILDAAPTDQGNTFNTWILFGDPTLMVRTDNPVSMNVTCNPSVLMLGMSNLEVTATDTPFGIATLMMDGEVLCTSYIQNGTANLEFPALSNVGSATLTVIGYNKVTEVIEIEVLPAEGPFVTVSSYEPNFAPVNQETNLSMSFKNVGVDPTTGVTTVTLTCADDRLTLLNGTATFDVLPADETVTLTNAFSFIVAEGVADGERFQIDVEMSCGATTWTGKAIITAGQAILDYAGTSWAGSYVPGETVTLVANFKNVGHYMATNAVATMTCDNPYVTVINESVEIGTIDPEGIAACTFQITIDATCPETEQIPVNFTMQADGGLTAEGSITLKNSCNLIFELNDSYGDGWNGSYMTVSFDDGTPSQTITLESGSTGTQTIEIGNGVHVTLTWTSNSWWDSECSFTLKYEDGTQICQISNPSAGVLFQFDTNCSGGGAPIIVEPVNDLTGEVDGFNITLYWNTSFRDDALYHVYRNGIEIGQTTEHSYTDEVHVEMVYTYCVVAELDGNFSAPTCIQIEFVDAVEESETMFSIFPNPVNNTLNINGGNAEYSYVMYNGMGQMVANGTARGTEQINVSDMAKGVYFLRLTSGTQVRVEKVVVE